MVDHATHQRLLNRLNIAVENYRKCHQAMLKAKDDADLWSRERFAIKAEIERNEREELDA